MERLGRSSRHEDDFNADQSSLEHVYQNRFFYNQDNDNDSHPTTTNEQKRVVQADDEPATISHTAVQMQLVHPATVHLPADIAVVPATSNSSSSASSKPKKHYTKKKQSRKLSPRSPTESGAQSLADASGDLVQEADYWQTGGSPTPSKEPTIMKPMTTHTGPDGKRYIRDTSIEVIEAEENWKRNLEKVFEKRSLPSSYQWYSILGTVCCFVIGAYSYKKSREVQTKFEAEDYSGAEKASVSARKWATVAFTAGALLIVVFLFLLFVQPCPLARALQADHICPRGT